MTTVPGGTWLPIALAALIISVAAEDVEARDADPGCHGSDPESRMECGVIRLLNAYRQRKGRRKLKFARTCYEMAKSHARTMRKHRDLSHEVVRGQGPDARANRFGLGKARTEANRSSPLRYSGENVARYYQTPEDVMRKWRWSLWGHNSNMLDRGHTHVGVGLAIARDRAGVPIEGQFYWAQVFCALK